MRKPKGVGLHDTLYYKSQKQLLKNYIDNSEMPVVTHWSEKTYYITSDRITFYLIPKDKYCLKESWVQSCENVFHCTAQYARDLFNVDARQIKPTGNKYALDSMYPENNIVMEFIANQDKIYIFEKGLELFPKQKVFFSCGENNPILVVSSLDTILGGVWPLKTFE